MRALRELRGRVAVVTGAASGIGRALARAFAAEQMKVVLADVQRAPLEATADELRATGGEVLAVPTDVTVPADVNALADRAEQAFGAIHVVCHNAGVFAGGLSWEAPISDYAWVFDVNVWGVIHGVRAFVPRQLAHGEEGHVVLTASMAAVTSTPFVAPYTMSKHAVLALAETLRLELAAKGAPIGVSVLCPELVHTRIGDAERNRPRRYERGPSHPERDLVEGAIRAATTAGIDPAEIAARALAAIRSDRFYVLAPEGDPFRSACHARLDAIRAEGQPVAAISAPPPAIAGGSS
jgi:NAD(P)-dependent dehydrogenase (short-subunit alcohol dehydrogenase family)